MGILHLAYKFLNFSKDIEDYNRIYPDISQENLTSSSEEKRNNFRLNEVSKCLSYWETELTNREKIPKKYKRSHSLLMKTNSISGILSVVLSGSGVTTALTGILSPIGVSLASIGGFFGIVSVLTKNLHQNLINIFRQ